MYYYFDTCAIVKAFHQETGSDRVAKLLTADAIHLSIYIELAQLNKITLVSADKKLCNIADALGYPYINPEIPPPQGLTAASLVEKLKFLSYNLYYVKYKK